MNLLQNRSSAIGLAVVSTLCVLPLSCSIEKTDSKDMHIHLGLITEHDSDADNQSPRPVGPEKTRQEESTSRKDTIALNYSEDMVITDALERAPSDLPGPVDSSFGTSIAPSKIHLYIVHLDLLACMNKRFGSRLPSIGSVIALIGSPRCAYATTCRQYSFRSWPLTGQVLIEALDELLRALSVGSRPMTGLY